jgi:hypothetical protein
LRDTPGADVDDEEFDIEIWVAANDVAGRQDHYVMAISREPWKAEPTIARRNDTFNVAGQVNQAKLVPQSFM